MKKIKSGFATEVGAELNKIEPDISLERATTMATFHLSRLNKDGKVGYEKYGKKFKYYIKNPADNSAGLE